MIKHIWNVILNGTKAKVYLVPGWLILGNNAMVVNQNTILLNQNVYKSRNYKKWPQDARRLMAHEFVHCVQFSMIKFFILRYLLESLVQLLHLKRPYRDNRYEVEARDLEALPVQIEVLPHR